MILEVDKQLGIVFDLIERYRSLGIEHVVNYKKYRWYLLTYHSTAIEGSKLSLIETELLLDEGIVPQGKPLEHINMVIDHHEILDNKNRAITAEYIQELNAKVMRRTRAFYRTALGDVDASKGEYRKGSVFAGSHTFPSYDKVPRLVNEFTTKLKEHPISDPQNALLLSFEAHYTLVSIHPFYDGNGRTSRLLMSHIQHGQNLPLAILHVEQKAPYIEALNETRKQEDLQIFQNFMLKNYRDRLENEIKAFKSWE